MKKPFHENWPLTQGFGENPSSYSKFGLKGHNGLDYGLPMGTDVIAPHNGKIIEVAFDAGGYGNYIKIENDKEGSVLAHLKESLVSIGSTVTEGQLIAHSNNTGNSTGPHLHWGYYLFPRDRTNGYAGFINQLPLLQSPQTDLQKQLDEMRKQRDANWDKYQAEIKAHDIDNKAKDNTISTLNTSITQLTDKINKIKAIIV